MKNWLPLKVINMTIQKNLGNRLIERVREKTMRNTKRAIFFVALSLTISILCGCEKNQVDIVADGNNVSEIIEESISDDINQPASETKDTESVSISEDIETEVENKDDDTTISHTDNIVYQIESGPYPYPYNGQKFEENTKIEVKELSIAKPIYRYCLPEAFSPTGKSEIVFYDTQEEANKAKEENENAWITMTIMSIDRLYSIDYWVSWTDDLGVLHSEGQSIETYTVNVKSNAENVAYKEYVCDQIMEEDIGGTEDDWKHLVYYYAVPVSREHILWIIVDYNVSQYSEMDYEKVLPPEYFEDLTLRDFYNITVSPGNFEY